MTGLVEEVRRAIALAPPSLVVEAALAELGRSAGVTEGDLLLVDYRMAELVPLSGGPADRRIGGPAWRCFDRQDVVNDGDAAYVPVSVRTDRFGVLRLGPADLVDAFRVDLPALGDLLAHELAAARSTTDRYAMAARTRRLTLAAEMQWEMLPGRSCAGDEFALAGQLEPAYAVRGDTFDWAVGQDLLTVSVIDGMGEGVAAASLSGLATNALRNARRAGLGIADQASLADSALFAHHKGSQYVSVLLLEIDLRTGVMSIVDTGSPLLTLVRGEAVTSLELGRSDPLGMFEGSRYASEEIPLESGDRLVLVSDGVHGAVAAGRRYAEHDLRRLITRSRHMSPLDVVRTLVGELRAFVAGDLADDAAAVCLDWTGR